MNSQDKFRNKSTNKGNSQQNNLNKSSNNNTNNGNNIRDGQNKNRKGRYKRIDSQKLGNQNLWKVYGKKPRLVDRELFEHEPRHYSCLSNPGRYHLTVDSLSSNRLKYVLSTCPTIEHQIITLRIHLQLTPNDYYNRYKFTKLLLTCLYRHHKVVYEGIMFGSTVNGLGFRDSDVDLRLRPLKLVSEGIYEPIDMDDDFRDKVLRNIAQQTTFCCPCLGDFVPSSRCPVAKLTFLNGNFSRKDFTRLQEGLKFDVSLSSSNPLGTFNSTFLRFLCYLEPKFHLLATVLRYWSSRHELIVPGSLSSYALINMLIFFCQTVEPPLLPSIDHMREMYLEHCVVAGTEANQDDCKKGLTQIEWHCMICLRKECYCQSANTEPLSLLLLKFFEMYLNFPYTNHIITTRPGRALTIEEFTSGTQFHPKFPMNTFINIQDPFDLKHNLTSGMPGSHFRLMMIVIRYSYEKLFTELLSRFERPDRMPEHGGGEWGINCLFTPLTQRELKNA